MMTVTTKAQVDAAAMSINETNYGYAMLGLGIEFDMQYQLGGFGMRGSQRVDFVAYVVPKHAAIFIQGAYWHGNKNTTEDQLKQAAAEQAGFWLLLVSEADSATLEAATAHARRNLL
jgi:G:T-mismatch repair DNA endonuclease (very short patch repair protein)